MQNQVERQQNLLCELQQTFGDQLSNLKTGDMVSADIDAQNLLAVGKVLRYDEPFKFEQLTDLCGVDYLGYGTTEWRTQETTESGYSRGVEPKSEQVLGWNKPR